MEMRELLPDNMALIQHLEETSLPGHPPANSSCLRDLSDPISWADCFTAFVTAKVNNTETRKLMAYGKIIISLVQEHGSLGWAAYDKMFRQ